MTDTQQYSPLAKQLVDLSDKLPTGTLLEGVSNLPPAERDYVLRTIQEKGKRSTFEKMTAPSNVLQPLLSAGQNISAGISDYAGKLGKFNAQRKAQGGIQIPDDPTSTLADVGSGLATLGGTAVSSLSAMGNLLDEGTQRTMDVFYDRVPSSYLEKLISYPAMAGAVPYRAAKAVTDVVSNPSSFWDFLTTRQATDDQKYQQAAEQVDRMTDLFSGLVGDSEVLSALISGGAGGGGISSAYGSPSYLEDMSYSPLDYTKYVAKPEALNGRDFSNIRNAFADAAPIMATQKTEDESLSDAYANALNYGAKALMGGRDLSLGEMIALAGSGFSASKAADREKVRVDRDKFNKDLANYALQKAELEGKLSDADYNTYTKNFALQNQYADAIANAKLKNAEQAIPAVQMQGNNIMTRKIGDAGKLQTSVTHIPTAKEYESIFGGRGGGAGSMKKGEKDKSWDGYTTSGITWNKIQNSPMAEQLIPATVRKQIEEQVDDDLQTNYGMADITKEDKEQLRKARRDNALGEMLAGKLAGLTPEQFAKIKQDMNVLNLH